MIKDEMERAVATTLEQWLNAGNRPMDYRAAFYFFAAGAEHGVEATRRIYMESQGALVPKTAVKEPTDEAREAV